MIIALFLMSYRGTANSGGTNQTHSRLDRLGFIEAALDL